MTLTYKNPKAKPCEVCERVFVPEREGENVCCAVCGLKRARDRFVLCVCGGRDYSDRATVFLTLDRVHAKRAVTLIIHGAARGADALASEWAAARGVKVGCFPADWEKHGRRAGPVRNAEMVAYGLDGLVAFPGGRGTADMVRQAKAAGVTVMEVRA